MVAMSGGVDSSVAAALLKKGRFLPAGRQVDVIGVFMKFWLPKTGRGYSAESEIRARKVAKILNIPFYIFNFSKEFKKIVVNDFLRKNRRGLTPNPCVLCNKEIKFGLLLQRSLKLDADFVATGHYVRRAGKKLFKAKDENKDQSYFLWRLNQKKIGRVLFPIGDYTRPEVEKMAKKFKFPFAGVKKSQEICFVETNVGDFLKRYLKQKPGNIINARGDILGRHGGLCLYTIGQRKGINLAGGPAFAKATAGKPYYVLDKDLNKNTLIVTRNEKDLGKKELMARGVNWISDNKPKFPLAVKVKIRYRSKSVPAIVKPANKGKIRVIFKRNQRAVTPGQSAVFYKGRELLGGGIIC